MAKLVFPDGNVREYDNKTPLEIAESISVSLKKKVISAKLDEDYIEVNKPITKDGHLKLIVADDEDKDSLYVLRHTCAHVLAQALRRLYGKDVHFGVGPAIDGGFYYDFDAEYKVSEEDFKAIEKEVKKIISENHAIEGREVSKEEALEIFKEDPYKVELINDLPADEVITVYTQGDFTDLCRGGHLSATSKIKEFKLLSVAGAYWRGNSDNKMLQRIYGTAWADKKQLAEYLTRLEEAAKRDHRKIGKALDLYHMQEEAPGMVFWHNDGWTIFRELETFVRTKLKEYDYQEVKGPFMMDRVLWEKTGHWQNYGDLMFTTQSENREYAIKPMNCPGHVQIFNQGLKSYRDLPIRMAEFGSCHRNEPSGSLHGLMRVRGFTQDDAHIFCTEDQIESEVTSCIKMVYDIYSTFGFQNIQVKLSTRPEKRIGADDMWDRAEAGLAAALAHNGLEYEIQEGEGAFYGPKIEFALRDCLDREWQCGTIQLDFALPGRLNASYVAEDNDRRTPVMIHRAILGSIERFIGIITEEYAGFFPAWLAPTQAVVMNITDSQSEYVQQVAKQLSDAGLRVKTDLRNEKVGFKIREHTLRRVPYMLVCGDKEIETGKVAVRTRKGQDLGTFTVEEFLDILKKQVRNRDLKLLGEE